MPESGMLPGKRKDFITHSEERNKNQPKQDVCRLARFKIGRGKVGRMPARDARAAEQRRATREPTDASSISLIPSHRGFPLGVDDVCLPSCISFCQVRTYCLNEQV